MLSKQEALEVYREEVRNQFMRDGGELISESGRLEERGEKLPGVLHKDACPARQGGMCNCSSGKSGKAKPKKASTKKPQKPRVRKAPKPTLVEADIAMRLTDLYIRYAPKKIIVLLKTKGKPMAATRKTLPKHHKEAILYAYSFLLKGVQSVLR